MRQRKDAHITRGTLKRAIPDDEAKKRLAGQGGHQLVAVKEKHADCALRLERAPLVTSVRAPGVLSSVLIWQWERARVRERQRYMYTER